MTNTNHRSRAASERVSISIARNVASFCGLCVAVAIALALMGAP